MKNITMHEDIYVFSQYAGEDRPMHVYMAGVSYCDESYKIERSSYEHYVIEYTLEGEGMLEAQGQRYTLRPGDVYFLYKGRGHRYGCSGEKWTKLWVVLDGEVADALFRIYLKGSPNVLHALDIEAHMRHILSLAASRDVPYAQMVDQMTFIVHRILAAAQHHPLKTPLLLQERIKDYIDAHLSEPFSLETLSELLHYSRNHIINVFRSSYGCTPYAYYEQQKMLVGRELLAETTESISAVTARLGMDSPQYFSKCFKKHFGLTPSEFRKCRSS